MRRMSVLFFSAILLLSAMPALAADASGTGLSELEVERRNSPCRGETGRKKDRCLARQNDLRSNVLIRKAQRSRGDSFRVGTIRLRTAEREARQERNAALLEKQRTFRRVTETEDLNTRRVDYLQEFRQDQFACMSEPAGRERNICLTNARIKMRAASRAQRGTLVRPAQLEE